MTPESPSQTRVLARDLALQVGRLNRQLRVRTRSGLTPSQSSLLTCLAGADVLSIGTLATNEGISAPTASIAVERLCAAGYCTRETDPDDARRQLVRLSPSGREVVRTSESEAVELLDRSISAMPPEETAALGRAVTALAEIVAHLTGDREAARAR